MMLLRQCSRLAVTDPKAALRSMSIFEGGQCEDERTRRQNLYDQDDFAVIDPKEAWQIQRKQ